MKLGTIPTTYAGRVQALCQIPRHGKRLLCVGTCDASEAILLDTVREGKGDYRFQSHPGHSTLRYHETRQRGVVNAWSHDHAPKPRSERLRELEAAADRFEPAEDVAA